MTYARAVATTLIAFFVSQLLAVAVHGFILAGDYAPYYGRLLRNEPGAPALFLPIAHLSFISSLVWIYGRLSLEGSHVVRGLTLGLAAWAVGEVPLWLRWYAEQPWPGDLVVKQLGLELLSSLILGLTIAFTARLPEVGSRVAAAARTEA